MRPCLTAARDVAKLRRVALTLVVALAMGGCRTRPGDACKSDEQCGPGFDCWQERCVRVCTEAGQCGAGETCVRYRCVAAARGVPEAAGTPADPGHDDTAAELRAIRQELERLREGQERILDAIEKKGGR